MTQWSHRLDSMVKEKLKEMEVQLKSHTFYSLVEKEKIIREDLELMIKKKDHECKERLVVKDRVNWKLPSEEVAQRRGMTRDIGTWLYKLDQDMIEKFKDVELKFKMVETMDNRSRNNEDNLKGASQKITV
jgi:hypothetical protein